MWLTSPVAPRHVGSSQTRARTRVPCIGRQILNHCTTREAQLCYFKPLKFWGVLATAVIITLITIAVAPKLSYDKLNDMGQIILNCKETYTSFAVFILYSKVSAYRRPKDTQLINDELRSRILCPFFCMP